MFYDQAIHFFSPRKASFMTWSENHQHSLQIVPSELTFSPHLNSHCLYKLVNGAYQKLMPCSLLLVTNALFSKSLSLKSAKILHIVRRHNRNSKPSVQWKLTILNLRVQFSHRACSAYSPGGKWQWPFLFYLGSLTYERYLYHRYIQKDGQEYDAMLTYT